MASHRNIQRHKHQNGIGKPPPQGGPGTPTNQGYMSTRSRMASVMSDVRAKTVLKEAVDAVVNSFAKHTHGYGRGESKYIN